MCLNESYTNVRVRETFLTYFLLRIFRRKNPFSTKLLHFALEYANRRVQVDLGGVKMKYYLTTSGLS